MSQRNCGRGDHLDRVVAIGDRVEAVGGDVAEAKLSRHALAVDGEPAADGGARAGGGSVRPLRCVPEALSVPLEHLDVRKQVM